ncbi:MAG: bifunctional folylpolyglutamate synthase/dihydrofolate synthase [Phycisphaerales bacterium]
MSKPTSSQAASHATSQGSRKPVRVEALEEAVPLRAKDVDNYTQALRYLGERVNFERTRPGKMPTDAFKLDRMRALMAGLGDPQRELKCVHIAGSKGKGSVAEMTAACLTGCGYATGLYTSPHLVDVRERVRINGEPIGYAPFARQMQRVAMAGENLTKELGEPTYFEIVTALALLHFAEEAVDAAVMEVGLGGRLDATNIITPEVCAVTAIQLEHTQLLGDTVEKIAAEKAGIFKAGVPAYTIPQAKGVMEVFREVADRVGAPLRVVGQDVEYSSRFEADHKVGPHCRVSVTSSRGSYEHLAVPLKGEHQAYNCGLALAVVDSLRERGFDVPERLVAEGLAKTSTAGRLETVSTSPRVVIDGAHTPDSVQCLMRALGAHVRYDSMVVVFGCADDKDARGMLARLAQGADKVIFTKASGNPRAADPRELYRRYVEISPKMAQVAPTLADALVLATKAVGRDDLICVTGSFYLAGEAKRLITEQRRPTTARG